MTSLIIGHQKEKQPWMQMAYIPATTTTCATVDDALNQLTYWHTDIDWECYRQIKQTTLLLSKIILGNLPMIH